MKKETVLSFKEEDLMQILADLEFLVVSLDRIGSASLSEEARKAEVYDFVIEGNAFKRLAAARRLISERLDESLSSEEIIALEEKLESVGHWKVRR